MLGKFGESSHGHDPIKLAKSFYTMSNDSFFALYGFNWVPPEPLASNIKRKLDSDFEKRMNDNL